MWKNCLTMCDLKSSSMATWRKYQLTPQLLTWKFFFSSIFFIHKRWLVLVNSIKINMEFFLANKISNGIIIWQNHFHWLLFFCCMSARLVHVPIPQHPSQGAAAAMSTFTTSTSPSTTTASTSIFHLFFAIFLLSTTGWICVFFSLSSLL